MPEATGWIKDEETGQYTYITPGGSIKTSPTEPEIQPRSGQKLATRMTSHLTRNRDETIESLKQAYRQKAKALQNTPLTDAQYGQRKYALQRNLINNISRIKQKYQQDTQPYQQIQQMTDQGQVPVNQAYEAMARLNLPADAERAAFRKPEAATGPGEGREPLTPSQLAKHETQISNLISGAMEKQWSPAESVFGAAAPGFSGEVPVVPGMFERKIPKHIANNIYREFTTYAGYSQRRPGEQRQLDLMFDKIMKSRPNVEWDPSAPDVKKRRQYLRGGQLSRAAAKSEKINKSPLTENFINRKSEPTTKPTNDPAGIL